MPKKTDQPLLYLYNQKSNKMINHFHPDQAHILQEAAAAISASFSHLFSKDFLYANTGCYLLGCFLCYFPVLYIFTQQYISNGTSVAVASSSTPLCAILKRANYQKDSVLAFTLTQTLMTICKIPTLYIQLIPR